MKKTIVLLLAALSLAALLGCQNSLKGTDALIQKAREEIPISDAETIAIQYAGCCGDGDAALLWFVSGDEYQSHYYLPMECAVVGEGEYTFQRTYQPIEHSRDIAALLWNRGYAFLVNDPRCATIRITDEEGTQDIAIGQGAYPYLLFWETIPTEYQFLDADGNEI